MNKPKFRHPDKFQILPWREYIRQNLPPGAEGFVAEDLDLIIRNYTQQDPKGKFMLIELKYGHTKLNIAQQRTFGLIDKLLKTSSENERYLGFYLVQYPHEDPDKCEYVSVNGVKLTLEEFKAFLKFELQVPSYSF